MQFQIRADELNLQGTARLSRGDAAGAIADFDRALSVAPRAQSARIYYNRGTARYMARDLRGAIDDFNQAIDIAAGLAEAWNNRGMARNSQGDLPGALADFEKAIALAPTYAEAYNNRGMVRSAQGDPGGALADFSQAIDIKPQHHRAYNNRAVVRQSLGDLPGALDDFDRAILLAPGHAEAWANRGIARQQLAFQRNPGHARPFTDEQPAPSKRSDLAEVLADFDRAIELTPRHLAAAAYHNRGAGRQACGDLPGALSDFDQAQAIDPSHALTYANRGTVHKGLGDLAAARADLDLAAELIPRRQAAAAYHNRGGVRALQKDFAGAVADYNIALEIEPGLLVAWLSRGNARYHLRDPRAFMDHVHVLTVDPRTGVEELLAMFVADAGQDSATLLRNCDRHLRINPNDIAALCRRGFSRLILGHDKEGGEQDLEKAVSLCPDLRTPLRPLTEAVLARAANDSLKPRQ